MVLSQITSTEIFAFITVQQKLLKITLLFKKIANFTGKLLQNYKKLDCKTFRILLQHVSDYLSFASFSLSDFLICCISKQYQECISGLPHPRLSFYKNRQQMMPALEDSSILNDSVLNPPFSFSRCSLAIFCVIASNDNNNNNNNNNNYEISLD